MVKTAMQDLPYTIETVTPANTKQVIGKAAVIMVGGGNTFKLLHDIYELKLLDLIRDQVNKGTAYIGWSAGSNITGPTIGTTNDMPIIEPKSLNALGILPFQINPHYTNAKPEGHHGETRDQRLEEFSKLNYGVPIVALPEGTALKLEQNVLQYIGEKPGVLFTSGEEERQVLKKEMMDKDDLSFLM
jgi:dipeptidase E